MNTIERHGTHYHATTPLALIDTLEILRCKGIRVAIEYGDTENGRFWGDVSKGRIGRSTGVTPVPLIVHNARSMGGEAILTHCILRITTTKGGALVYQHEKVYP